MVLDRDKLKKLRKEKGVKNLDDFNAFMRGVSKDVIETLLEEELTDHLGFEKYDQKAKAIDNSRNGYTPKTVKSKFGEIGLDVPRDRRSEFEPQVVKKRKKDIAGLEEKIISMYAKGMTTRDIQAHIKDLYNYKISPETVSAITDKVIERAREWQSRPVESIYAVIYMDAVFLKMRTEGHVRNVAVYTIIGINLDGHKECLGKWICETESAKYWLSVLNELKNRGLEDVLIFSVDNLKGISEAIEAVFPQAEVQKCIIHQIRNSLRYVYWKERKAMAKDLRQRFCTNVSTRDYTNSLFLLLHRHLKRRCNRKRARAFNNKPIFKHKLFNGHLHFFFGHYNHIIHELPQEWGSYDGSLETILRNPNFIKAGWIDRDILFNHKNEY